MKRHLITALLVVWVSAFLTVSCGFAQEEEQELTPKNFNRLRTLPRFVGRMLQTRDVAQLFDESFLSGFISHFKVNESVTPAVYARLTRTERRRLFVAQNNFSNCQRTKRSLNYRTGSGSDLAVSLAL